MVAAALQASLAKERLDHKGMPAHSLFAVARPLRPGPRTAAPATPPQQPTAQQGARPGPRSWPWRLPRQRLDLTTCERKLNIFTCTVITGRGILGSTGVDLHCTLQIDPS